MSLWGVPVEKNVSAHEKSLFTFKLCNCTLLLLQCILGFAVQSHLPTLQSFKKNQRLFILRMFYCDSFDFRGTLEDL